MPVFAEWLNANEVRRYPLHDHSTGLDVNGRRVPDNIIVDARIWVPKSLGRVVFVSSIGITSGLVTATFLAASGSPFLQDDTASSSSGPGGFVPLAVVRVARPVTRFVNVAVEALSPGVGGWVAFGEGAVSIEQGNWRFDGPEAAQLNERAVQAYDDAAVSGLGKAGTGASIGGLVRLRGEPGILRTFKATRTIEGMEREVAVIAMDLSENKVTRLQEFSGVCGRRPQAGTCSKPALERINNVEPDVAGNVELVFEGDAVVGDIGRGMIVDFPVGLAEQCPTDIDDNVDFPPPGGPPSPIESSTSPEPPEPPIPGSSSSGSLDSEYCEDFEDDVADELDVVQGSFAIEEVAGRSKRYISASGLVTPQFATDVFRQLDADVEAYIVKATIRPLGAEGNGFVIAGYRNSNSFLFAGISLRDGGKFFIGRKVFSGGAWPNGLGQGFVFDLDFAPAFPTPLTDYRVSLLIKNASLASLRVRWNDGTADREQTQPVSLTSFNEVGQGGLGVVGAETEFDDFGINCQGSSSSGFGI